MVAHLFATVILSFSRPKVNAPNYPALKTLQFFARIATKWFMQKWRMQCPIRSFESDCGIAWM